MELYDSKFVYFDWEEELLNKKVFIAEYIEDIKLAVNSRDMSLTGYISPSTNREYPFESANLGFIFAYYDPDYNVKKAFMEGETIEARYKDGDDWFHISKETAAGGFNFDDFEIRLKPKIMCYVVISQYNMYSTYNPDENEMVLFKGTEEECIKWIKDYEPFEDIMFAWRQGKTIQYKNEDKWYDWILQEIPHDSAFDTWKEWRIKEDVESVPFDSVQELINAWEEKYPQNKNRPEGTMPLIWVNDKGKNRVHLITSFLFEQMLGYDIGMADCYVSLEQLFKDFTFADGTVIGKVKENKEND